MNLVNRAVVTFSLLAFPTLSGAPEPEFRVVAKNGTVLLALRGGRTDVVCLFARGRLRTLPYGPEAKEKIDRVFSRGARYQLLIGGGRGGTLLIRGANPLTPYSPEVTTIDAPRSRLAPSAGKRSMNDVFREEVALATDAPELGKHPARHFGPEVPGLSNPQENFVGTVDLDGDGADEIVTAVDDGSTLYFLIYTRRAGAWLKVFQSAPLDSGC